MTDERFESTLASLRDLPFREDFEAGLTDLYTAATPMQRTKLRDMDRTELGGSKTWRNPTDYFRSDLTHVQKQWRSLMTLSLCDGLPDGRETLRSLASCYHNLGLRGFDADAIFRQVAAMSAPKFAELVLGFSQRSNANKSMEAFCLKVEQTPDGPIATEQPPKRHTASS